MTCNIDDNYMGSGKAIKNAILKYGIENFTKEIIAETTSTELLWELEKEIITHEIVNDPLSYNMAFGGKGYLDGLKKYDFEKFIQHQSTAGKIGGLACYNSKSIEEKKNWHSAGGKAVAKINKLNSSHPFYNGIACKLGGKAVKDMIELWNPSAVATNKNQKTYNVGDCKKAKLNSDKYNDLINNGWLTIDEHIKNITNHTIE